MKKCFLFLLLCGCTPSSPIADLKSPLLQKAEQQTILNDTVKFSAEGDFYEFRKLASGDLEKAKNYIRMIALAIRQDRSAPYPGNLTKTVVCDASTAPKPEAFAQFDGYWLFADERHSLNGCKSSQATFEAFWGTLHCPTSDFEIKAIFLKTTLDKKNKLLSFSCT